MGLDVSHDCFQGAYSSFSRWRNEVAKAAGFATAQVQFRGESYGKETVLCEWHQFTDKRCFGEWDKNPDNILYVLFFHSDCEGVIKPAQGLPLADALEELLPKLREMGKGEGHIKSRGGYEETTIKFIAGLRDAAKAGEDVEFF